MEQIHTESIKYIKNVNDDEGWAYDSYPVGAYFRLNFKNGDCIENHVLNLPKGDRIILSQRPRAENKRYLTHIVELVNEGNEDKPQWGSGTWDIFRWVKVHWVADLSDPSRVPVDEDVIKANWGWYNTKAKALSSPSLMTQWRDIETLMAHLENVFN